MPEQTRAFTYELVRAERRSRFNPLRELTAEKLAAYLDEFRAGHLGNMARVMEAIEERDDTLACVVPKTKAAVARHGFEVLTVGTESDEQAALARRQKQVLEAFYNNLRATDALDQDEIGGFSLLVRQMMDAKGKRYSVHNIVWEPQPGGRYTATFHHVPLWFFENTEGRLRFIDTPYGYYGREMEPGAWLVTKGDGLLIPCCVAWMFKHLPLRDWLIYCSRHGMPGIEGITDAAEGSDEWNNLLDAVAAAASEFAWVRNRSSEIRTVDFSAQGQLPYPALIERMDRAMIAIWRGGDLGTMSKDGQAVGSNPQESETSLIEEDDAAWITETLNFKVDRLVLDYTFGPGTPALAYVKLLTAQKQNIDLDLRIDEFALRNGHPISREQFAERYNRPIPERRARLLGPPIRPPQLDEDPVLARQKAFLQFKREFEAAQAAQADQAAQAASATNDAGDRLALAQSVAEDLRPIRERLAAILNIEDAAIQRQRLKAFLDELPALVRDIVKDPATARIIENNIHNNIIAGINASDEGGVWRTINGVPVFIKDGQSVGDAIAEKFGGDKGAKSQKKNSTSEGESNTIKADDEKNSGPRIQGGKRDRLVESALRDVGGGGERVSSFNESDAERDARAKREKSALYDWADANGKRLSADKLLKTDKGGGEHKIVLMPEKGYVIKETRADIGYGSGLAANNRQAATAAEYLDRIQMANEEFGCGIKLTGVISTVRGPVIQTRMPYVSGDDATPAQIEAAMTKIGYRRIGDGAYYNDKKGILSYDLKPQNVRTRDGKIFVLDPIMQRATPRDAAELEKFWFKLADGGQVNLRAENSIWRRIRTTLFPTP